MGYRVEYENGKKQGQEWGIRRILFSIVFFLALTVVLKFCWPEGAGLVRQLILPNDVVAVWQGTDQLARQLGEGIPLEFAIKDFYHGVTEICN